MLKKFLIDADEFTKISNVKTEYTKNGSTKHSVVMSHEKLHEHKTLISSDLDVLVEKVQIQVDKWIDKWVEKREKIEMRQEKQRTAEEKELEKSNNIAEADNRTAQAVGELNQLENLLLDALTMDSKLSWENLKRKEKCPENVSEKPQKPRHEDYPLKPDKRSPEFTPTFSLLEKIFVPLQNKKMQKLEEEYTRSFSQWYQETKEIDALNKKAESEYEECLNKWGNTVLEYEKRRSHYLEQDAFNAKIDQKKESYLTQNTEALIYWCEAVLDKSKYPDFFSKNYELEYNQENKILIVEYELPIIDDLPKMAAVMYTPSKKEFKETYISETEVNKNYDDTIYKIALRTTYELFMADTIDAIEAISFNGWVTAINAANGIEETNCILSLHVSKKEFQKIELLNVDPKACFRKLKGVASSKLSTLTPVQPILQINKTDRRFVESYEVANKLDNTTNLAAMDWEEFEHLIRELFEKEFHSAGGEVKVTQASRDGGVDAIAFDPDPIRGGKIVIQAKRYTNTVGVSAVRDLFGTVLNEGANKGILVTTSDYGPDAYEFAKGKPITLMNGSNLLFLLEKHGHHAKIDIREAKRLFSEEAK